MSQPRTEAGRRLLAGTNLPPGEGGYIELPEDEMAKAILAIEAEAGNLDAAWAEAEAALPEGTTSIVVTIDHYGGDYFAAMPGLYPLGSGPTPAAALRALIAKYREQER